MPSEKNANEHTTFILMLIIARKIPGRRKPCESSFNCSKLESTASLIAQCKRNERHTTPWVV